MSRAGAMTWLVTGGAGYIGAHVVRALLRADHRVVVLDDLSTGERGRVPRDVVFAHGSVCSRASLDQVLTRHDLCGVVHIAAKKQVAQSMADPLLYWHENVGGMTTLLQACRAAGVEQVVFSSSAAVYGMPSVDTVSEDAACAPASPYGDSKLACERLMLSAAAAYGLRAVVLRYFNVAGAESPDLADDGVSNLVPMVFQRLQQRERPRIFGADYPTADGTCVRDFVHVADVAAAHVLAARALAEGAGTSIYNVGRGEGASVRQVVDVICEVTGIRCAAQILPRRPGDPPRVVAAVGRIEADLGFRARHDLVTMVQSAWDGWRVRHDAVPNG